MTDYGNIPVLKWAGAISAKKASAQLLHAEPLILQMPEDFRMAVDASACGCREGKKPGSHLDCNAEILLKSLAKDNAVPELDLVADAAHEAGQVADLDTDRRRIIIHD